MGVALVSSSRLREAEPSRGPFLAGRRPWLFGERPPRRIGGRSRTRLIGGRRTFIMCKDSRRFVRSNKVEIAFARVVPVPPQLAHSLCEIAVFSGYSRSVCPCYVMHRGPFGSLLSPCAPREPPRPSLRWHRPRGRRRPRHRLGVCARSLLGDCARGALCAPLGLASCSLPEASLLGPSCPFSFVSCLKPKKKKTVCNVTPQRSRGGQSRGRADGGIDALFWL
jgi:hypothetical protein